MCKEWQRSIQEKGKSVCETFKLGGKICFMNVHKAKMAGMDHTKGKSVDRQMVLIG